GTVHRRLPRADTRPLARQLRRQPAHRQRKPPAREPVERDRHARGDHDGEVREGNMLDRRSFLVGAVGLAAFAVRSRAAAAPAFMYIGSFTRKDGGHGEGLSVYRRANGSEPWTLVEVNKELADPSFVVIDRRGRHLYSSHGDGTHATAYRIDQVTGRLTVVNRQPTGGV